MPENKIRSVKQKPFTPPTTSPTELTTYIGTPLLAGGAPTDEADVVLKPALARFDDCLLVAEGDLGCKAPASWRAFSVQLWVYGALTPHWGGEAPQNQSWRGSVGLSSGFMAFGAVVAVPRRYKTKAKTLDRWLGLGFYRFGRPRRG